MIKKTNQGKTTRTVNTQHMRELRTHVTQGSTCIVKTQEHDSGALTTFEAPKTGSVKQMQEQWEQRSQCGDKAKPISFLSVSLFVQTTILVNFHYRNYDFLWVVLLTSDVSVHAHTHSPETERCLKHESFRDTLKQSHLNAIFDSCPQHYTVLLCQYTIWIMFWCNCA